MSNPATLAPGTEHVLLRAVNAWNGPVPAGTIVRVIEIFDADEPYGVVAVDDTRPEHMALFSARADELAPRRAPHLLTQGDMAAAHALRAELASRLADLTSAPRQTGRVRDDAMRASIELGGMDAILAALRIPAQTGHDDAAPTR